MTLNSITNKSPIKNVDYKSTLNEGDETTFDLEKERHEVTVICENGEIEIEYLTQDKDGNYTKDGKTLPLSDGRSYSYDFHVKSSSPDKLKIRGRQDGSEYTFLEEKV